MARVAAQAALDKRGKDPVILDMHKVTLVADYFVITSAASTTQVRAIADGIEERLEEADVQVRHREGYDIGRWVLLDYGSVVVHIFNEVERTFYNLEHLWSDAVRVAIDSSPDQRTICAAPVRVR